MTQHQTLNVGIIFAFYDFLRMHQILVE